MTTRLTVATCVFMLMVGRPASGLQSSFTTSDGVRLAYEVHGEGSPLVLIHGWSLNMTMWDDQLPAFSREFRVVRYDRRGFGQSQGVEDASRGAQDLWELLQHLGINSAHILGHSQGGMVATAFALAYPKAVTSLILHGAQPLPGFPVPWTGPTRPINRDEGRELIEREGLAGFRRTWASHPFNAVPADKPEAKAKLMRILEAYSGGFFLNPATPALADIRSRLPTWDQVRSIKASTLVLVGDGEIPHFRAVADSLAARLPRAERATLTGGGHMINLIEPETYNLRVLQFLAKVAMQK